MIENRPGIYDIHLNEYKEKAQVAVVIPGVTKFLGNFSDYCNGYTLTAADSRKLYISVSKREDNSVYVLNATVKDRKHFTLGSYKYRKEDKWLGYVKAIISILVNNYKEVCGLNIVIEGNLVKAAGELLSASVSTGLCMAVSSLFKLNLKKSDIGRFSYEACNSLCKERSSYSTIQTLMNAKEGKYLYYDISNLTLDYLDDVFCHSEYMLTSVDCSVAPFGMREEIDEKYVEIEKAVCNLRHTSGLEKIKNLSDVKLDEYSAEMSKTEKKICSFILEECRLSSSIKRLFNDKDIITVGKVFSKYQRILRNDLDLTCPEYDWLIKRCTEVGSCVGNGAAINGAEGSVIIIIKRENVDDFKVKLDDYEHIFGSKAKLAEFVPQDCAKVL